MCKEALSCMDELIITCLCPCFFPLVPFLNVTSNVPRPEAIPAPMTEEETRKLPLFEKWNWLDCKLCDLSKLLIWTPLVCQRCCWRQQQRATALLVPCITWISVCFNRFSCKHLNFKWRLLCRRSAAVRQGYTRLLCFLGHPVFLLWLASCRSDSHSPCAVCAFAWCSS